MPSSSTAHRTRPVSYQLSREEGTSGWIWGSPCALPVWLQDFSADILSSDLLGAFCIQGGPCLGIHLSHLGRAPVSGPL